MNVNYFKSRGYSIIHAAKLKRGFIKDIVVCCVPRTTPENENTVESDGETASELLKANGYQLLWNYRTDDLLKNYENASKRIYFGVKYTSNPDSAVNNIHLVYTASNDYYKFHDAAMKMNDFEKWDYSYEGHSKNDLSEEEWKEWQEKCYYAFWGSHYMKPIKCIEPLSTNSWDSNSYGDLWYGVASNPLHIFLWQEKNPEHEYYTGTIEYGDSVWATRDLLFDFTKNTAYPYNSCVNAMAFNGNETKGYNAIKDPIDITPGTPGAINTFLTTRKHNHNYDLDGYDEHTHHKYCTLCNYKTFREEHTHGYTRDGLGYLHRDSCTHNCGYSVSVHCADTTDFKDNGIGLCKACGQTAYQPAVKDSNGVYQIKNEGQLCWFSRRVAYDEPDANAILMADINVTEGAFKPIGFATPAAVDSVRVYAAKNDSITENGTKINFSAFLGVGYSGTFDGNGHTVSFTYTCASDNSNAEPFDRMRYADGMFNFVNGGTVKNLGIADNSVITSNKTICGSVAGFALNATFENIYSRATINHDNYTITGLQTAGMVGMLSASTLKNGYFAGRLFCNPKDTLDKIAACANYISKYSGITEEQARSIGGLSTVSNFYYDPTPANNYNAPETKEEKNQGLYPEVHIMTSNDFESGKVCYLLNNCDSIDKNIWHQKINQVKNNDFYPVLRSDTCDNYIVYGGYKHGEDESIFSNSKDSIPAECKHKYAYNAKSNSEAEGNHDKSYMAEYTWPVEQTDIDFVPTKFTCSVCGNVVDTLMSVSHDTTKTDIKVNCEKDGHKYYVGNFKFNKDSEYTDSLEWVTDALSPNREHTYDENGFGCAICKDTLYQKPQSNDEGIWEIANGGQLYWLSKYVNYQKDTVSVCNAVLTNDIVVNKDMSLEPSSLRQWVPIGCGSDKVTGVITDTIYNGSFDGCGHTISGLYCNRKYYSGLFGKTKNCTVKNLGLINSVFIGANHIGSIAGCIKQTCVENIYSTAVVRPTASAPKYFGGLVGALDDSKISNAYYDGAMENAYGCLFYNFPINTTINNVYARQGKYQYNNHGYVTLSNSDFTSGKLCYLLNDSTYGKDAVWHQNIDASDIVPDGYQPDNAPVLARTHSMVVPAQYNGKDFINLHMDCSGDSVSYYRDSFDVYDKYDFSCPVDFTVMGATQTRDMTGYTMGTVCLPFNIDHAANDGIKLYKMEGINTEDEKHPVIIVVAVDSLPACTPAIFEKIDSTANSVKFVCDECTVSACSPSSLYYQRGEKNEEIVGGFHKTILVKDNIAPKYAFNTQTNLFTLIEDGDYVTVKPFRAWFVDYSNILGPNSQHRPQYYFKNIDPYTGVNEIQKDAEVINVDDLDMPIYDISGRRISIPFKGQIIIRKGKKIINK